MAFQARLLSALSDPDLSLHEVADRLSLPLDQLALVLTRPDLIEEIARLDSLAAVRVRLVATSLLPAAAQTARVVIEDFNTGDSTCPRETALRAARILLRLANFASGPVAPRPAPQRAERTGTAQPSVDTRTPSKPVPIPSPQPAPELVALPGLQRDTAAVPDPVPPTARLDDSELLSEADTLALAIRLIRQGSFTPDQLGELFRLAAAESGDQPDHAFFDTPEDLATEFESIAASLKDTPDPHHTRHPPQPRASAHAHEPECVPP